MDLTSRALTVPRGPYGLYAELTPGTGVPLVLLHGFPDNTHLYDRLVPHLAGRRPVVRFDLDRRFYAWQVGGFIQDPAVRDQLVPQLYAQSLPARPAFWRLNDDLLTAVAARRRRLGELRRFGRPVRVIFGARDRYLNPRVARSFAAVFPNSELHLLEGAGHYVQVDQPQRVAALILGG